MRRQIIKSYGKPATIRLLSLALCMTAVAWFLLTVFDHAYPAKPAAPVFIIQKSHVNSEDNTLQKKVVGSGHFAKLALDQDRDEVSAESSHSLTFSSVQSTDSSNSVQQISSSTTERQDDVCHSSQNTEYGGDVVKWGTENHKESAVECCQQCRDLQGCNTWVWCARSEGCGTERRYRECWLKRQNPLNLLDIHSSPSHPGNPWTSGALYSDAAMQAAVAAEATRLRRLREDPALPLVWLEVSIKGQLVGRIVMALFTRESPRAAENFRALCTGEKGTVPEGREGAGQQYHFKGKAFYRIIDRFIDQAGAGTESVFGGHFKDDAGGLKLKHDRKGLLSMANTGSDTNTSHFSILMAAAPHLDGKYTIFGEVVEGFEVAEKVNALSRGQPNNEAGMAAEVIISDSGQIRCGEPCGLATTT